MKLGSECTSAAMSRICFFSNRQGSGSACRSVYGGFVKWERGEREDGGDSVAVQVRESIFMVASSPGLLVPSFMHIQYSSSSSFVNLTPRPRNIAKYKVNFTISFASLLMINLQC